jgi:hypothetical protein
MRLFAIRAENLYQPVPRLSVTGFLRQSLRRSNRRAGRDHPQSAPTSANSATINLAERLTMPPGLVQ